MFVKHPEVVMQSLVQVLEDLYRTVTRHPPHDWCHLSWVSHCRRDSVRQSTDTWGSVAQRSVTSTDVVYGGLLRPSPMGVV